nr:sensor histidine kinase [Shimazuella soli]
MNISGLLKKDNFILILMIVTVPLASELNFYPFNESFRISFAAPTFFFFLLLFRKMPVILPGLLTAILIVGFRIVIDSMTLPHFDWTSSLQNQFSAFFYYFTYSLLFYLFKVNRFYERPLVVGVMGFFIEIFSDLFEMTVQYIVLGTMISWIAFYQVMIIAISHSFMVLSFFSMWKLYEAQVKAKHIAKQNEHMLMLISNLYEEAIHLKKTLQTIENTTKKSYDLYKSLHNLKEEGNKIQVEEWRRQALKIAGDIHEVKKDNQRIYAGLAKLISDEGMTDFMHVRELLEIIIRINRKYAGLNEKSIRFDYQIEGKHPRYHVFTVLSIINNLMANAVEAILKKGRITLCVSQDGEFVEFQVIDNGPGIAPKHYKLIYKPGFTTKYDDLGNSSTGIGLFYVKEMVEELGGSIDVQSAQGCNFHIRLPIYRLIKKG